MSSLNDVRSRVSVEYLVRQWNRKFGTPEQWYLGIVQRDEVWKPEQRVNLLDSLLKAYPIGSILLGRSGDSTETTTVYVKDETGHRAEEEVTADTWQILDGQQRMSTLASIFSRGERPSEDGRGHMELDMMDPAGGMHWVVPRQSKLPRPDSRSQRVDLSGWSAFMLKHDRDELERAADDDVVLRQLLAELDGDFTVELSGDRSQVARARWGELLSLWTEERIPVLAAPVRSPEQLLEVFTRVNLGGTVVSQTDIYYAAVRTFWPEAETSLQRIVLRVGGLLDRFAVLEFASRFARVAFGAADPINVDVAILNGPQGKVLRRALTEMCAADSEFLFRLEVAATWLVESSRLGWGLHSVHRRAIAAVLAWAIASPEADRRKLIEDSAHDIDAFLAGTTLFGYRSRLRRDRFDRVAFREAIAAGQAGHGFPGVQIREVLRQEEGDEGLSRIDPFETTDNRRAIGDRHPSLVLSAVQMWPFHAGELHIDHIYANEASKRDMLIDGHYGRKRTHADRSATVNSLGNFWLIPSATNESLGADRPVEKFGKLNTWLSDPEHHVPARDLWAIDPEMEEKKLLEIEGELVTFRDNAGVNTAMSTFRQLVESRADRLVGEFVRILPGSSEFAREVLGPGAEPSDIPDELAACLGLAQYHLDFEAEGNPLPSARAAAPLTTPWTGPWAGREEQVRRVWQEVSQRRKDGRLMPEQPGSKRRDLGFAYCRWAQVTRTSSAWFGARLEVTEGDPSPLSVTFVHVAPSVREALLESSLEEWVPASASEDISIPVPIDPGLPERRAVEAVIDFFYQLDIILEGKQGVTD